MTRYFAHISQKGKIRYGDVPGSIGVLEALDKFMPIGEASCRTHDENGLAVWTLRIGKEEIPGRWIIVEREKTGQIRYWQYGQVEKSPDLAISDLSRFPCLHMQEQRKSCENDPDRKSNTRQLYRRSPAGPGGDYPQRRSRGNDRRRGWSGRRACSTIWQ